MFMQMTDTISQNVAKKLFWSVLISKRSPETPEQEAEQKLPGLSTRRVVLCFSTSHRRHQARKTKRAPAT